MNDIALKEYVEAKISALRELTEVRFEQRDEALRLKSLDTERRLDHLNNETARAAERDKSYVPRELYDTSRDELSQWRTKVDSYMASNAGREKGIGLVWAAVPTLISVVAIVIAFLKGG